MVYGRGFKSRQLHHYTPQTRQILVMVEEINIRLGSALRLFVCALVALAFGGCSITHAYRVADAQRVDLSQMVSELGDVPLVLVGEQHDDMDHHELQLRLIELMQQQGRPLAIGLEMFEIQHQGALDAWVAGRLPEGAFIPVYQANWRNLSWGFYRAIFVYARDQRIPLVALNAPRDTVQKVARHGLTTLSESDLKAMPPGVGAPLDNRYLSSVTDNMGAIPGHNVQANRYIPQAQALRNRVMAQTARHYLAAHPQTRLVVLTGGLHAWRQGGIPAELQGLAHKVILPPMSGMDVMNLESADYVLD